MKRLQPLASPIGSFSSFCLCSILIALLVNLLAAYISFSEDDSLLFHDAFTKPPAAPWTWIRENPKTHQANKDGLSIQLEPGGLMGAGKDAKNILVQPLQKSAQTVTVQIDFNPKKQYEQGGLLLYGDDDTYIKLVQERVDGKTWLVMIAELKTVGALVGKVPAKNLSGRIGFQWKNDIVQGMYWQQKRENAILVGTTHFPMNPKPRVGIFTQSGHHNIERWARFMNFRIGKTRYPLQVE